MKTETAISVVVPIYNASAYLREALNSLLAQTFKNFEAICVNDGSTDDSLDILRSYADKDSRIRIIDQPNGGYGKAMNTGFDASVGKYLAILEPDDYLPENAYEVLYKLAEEYQLDIAKGCVQKFIGDGADRVFSEPSSFAKGNLNVTFCPRNTLGVFRFNMNTWTCLYNIDFLRKNNIRHNESAGAAYQDNGMFILSFSYANKLRCVNDVVNFHRMDNPQSSNKRMHKNPNIMRDEYAYIRHKLQQTPEIWKKTQAAYVLLRMMNHRSIYDKLQYGMQLEYLEEYRKELLEMQNMDCSMLSAENQKFMKEILQSPLLHMLCNALREELKVSSSSIINNFKARNGETSLKEVKALSGEGKAPKKRKRRSFFGLSIGKKNNSLN